ncbi:MAG: polysaccharide deacetylase family protein [Sphingorhabdus sp.]
MSNRPKLALSFDVECYYQIVRKDYLDQHIAPTEEALRNTHWIMDLLSAHDARATMFFLGNIAETFPELVQRAETEGHEIGVHGDQHHYVDKMEPDEFRREIKLAMDKIYAAGASKIVGHRATAFSINRANMWALDILQELGLSYDSSIFPVKAARYGVADWPRGPEGTPDGIDEIPLSTYRLGNRNVPCMGGGYVRYFPLAYTKWCAKRLTGEGLTPVSYFHPYEFEDKRPEFTAEETAKLSPERKKAVSRMNMMQSIGRGAPMRRKLEYLVRNFKTIPVGALAPSITN